MIKLYNLEQKEDGSVTVQTELSPEDMLALLTIGMYACMERGVMVKSLAGHFNSQDDDTTDAISGETFDIDEYLDVAKEED